ncbi:MAG: kelch repeat-containing protein [Myxococcales bacterium]
MSRKLTLLAGFAMYLATLLGACGADDDDGSVGQSGSSGISGSDVGGFQTMAGATARGGAAGQAGSDCDEGDAITVSATWKLLEKSGNGPSPRFSVSVAPLKEQLLLFGGGTFLTGGSNETWFYDLTGDARWSLGSSTDSPPARGAQALVGIDDERAFLFGGQGLELYDDTWLWDGTTWQNACEDTACGEPPAARAGHALVLLDQAASRVVMMGGQDAQGVVGDTWSWSEQDGWRQICSSECDEGTGGVGNGAGGASSTEASSGAGGATGKCCGFGARFDHAAAADPETGQLLMHGGHDGNQELASLWSLKGDRWRELTSDGEQPSARSGHAMAFHAAAKLFVLYGGTRDGQAVTDELWAYAPDVQRWYAVRVDGEKPPTRGFGGFVYDRARQQLLMFGGSAQGTYGDLWSLQVARHVGRSACDGAAGAGGGPGGAPNGGMPGAGAPGGGTPGGVEDPCVVLGQCCSRLTSTQDRILCQNAANGRDPDTCTGLADYCQ